MTYCFVAAGKVNTSLPITKNYEANISTQTDNQKSSAQNLWNVRSAEGLSSTIFRVDYYERSGGIRLGNHRGVQHPAIPWMAHRRPSRAARARDDGQQPP